MSRIHKLAELAPQFVRWDGREPGAEHGAADAIRFLCPEGHEDCSHTIPFTPALDGASKPSPQQNGAHWQRRGDTFETLVLSPSIRCTGWCHFHGFIGGSSGQMPGSIEFCGDSSGGPKGSP